MLNMIITWHYADGNCITIYENASKIALNATCARRKNVHGSGLPYVCIALFLCLCVSEDIWFLLTGVAKNITRDCVTHYNDGRKTKQIFKIVLKLWKFGNYSECISNLQDENSLGSTRSLEFWVFSSLTRFFNPSSCLFAAKNLALRSVGYSSSTPNRFATFTTPLYGLLTDHFARLAVLPWNSWGRLVVSLKRIIRHG